MRLARHPSYNLLLLAFVVWGVLALLGSILWPLGFDQGTFAWVGDVILRGGAPYHDAWEVKGPATYYTYAGCQLLFGRNMAGIRVFDLALLLLGAAALRRLAAEWARRLWADFAALLFIFIYLRGGYWNTATSDGFATLFVVLAAALVMRRASPPPGHIALAGMLAGLALMYKVTALALVVPVAGYLVLAPGRRLDERILSGILFTCALGIVAGLWVELLACQQGLAEFLDINRFNRVVYTPQPRQLSSILQDFTRNQGYLWYLLGLGALGLWPGVSVKMKRTMERFDNKESSLLEIKNRGAVRPPKPWVDFLFRKSTHGHDRQAPPNRFIGSITFRQPLAAAYVFWLAWLLLSLAAVVAQAKYYTYHFIPLYPALAVLAALGLDQLEYRSPRLPERRLLLKLAAVLALFFCRPELNMPAFHALATEHQLGARYYSQFLTQVHTSVATTCRTAAWLRDHTAPADRIQVWGWDNLLYFLSGRPAATRFGFISPLVLAHDTGSADYLRRYTAEYLAGLRREPPKYIVIATLDRNNLTRHDSKAYLREAPFQGIAAYLRTHYRQQLRVNNYEIWARHP